MIASARMRPRTLPLLPLLATLGCSSSRPFWDAARAADQREAGSVHLAVLAVAPWSHYAAALQPDFRLDAEQARREVLRETRSTYDQSTRMLGVDAGVTENPEENDLVGGKGGPVRTGTLLAGGEAGRNEAMLEYQAAASLFQEVQLLNRSIRDAAIPTGYRPYLVRLQITLLPRRRNAPYDAYTTLSFFSPASGEDAERAADEPLVATLRGDPAERRGLAGDGPVVLPLVATDNLETSRASRSQQDLSNLSLAFLGFPGDFATSLSAELFQQELQAQVAGRDLNGLLTIGRVSENTLRVRIGAMQQASARHAMVPRNHAVTLLLMVPEDAPPVVDLVAQTVLVDTETGAELAATSAERSRALLERVAGAYPALALDAGRVAELLARVRTNDQTGFRALLARAGEEPAAALEHELWIDLVSLQVGSQFSSSRFELPGHGDVDIPSDDFFAQTALLVDDGEASTIAIHGGTFGERAQVAAQLRLDVGGRALVLSADAIERREQELRVRFPSLAALGLAPSASAGFDLTLRWAGDETVFDGLYVRRQAAPAPAPAPAGPP